MITWNSAISEFWGFKSSLKEIIRPKVLVNTQNMENLKKLINNINVKMDKLIKNPLLLLQYQ